MITAITASLNASSLPAPSVTDRGPRSSELTQQASHRQADVCVQPISPDVGDAAPVPAAAHP
jgi:hypothetical protein